MHSNAQPARPDRVFSTLLLAAAIGLAAAPARAKEGKVTVPLATWEQMLREVEQTDKEVKPPVVVLPASRSIDGRLQKGLFVGTLTAAFTVLDAGGHVRVPVVDAAASVGSVRLNGGKTSLLKEGDLYTVGVDKPGDYVLVAELFWGKEQDDFARQLRLRLPEGGATRFSIVVPERDIEAKVEHGVLVREEQQPGGTRLLGQLDPTGQLDLSWSRKLSHLRESNARTRTRMYTVFTVEETVIRGLSALELEVLEGETARVDLQLPADIEVLSVDGDAVLQWYTSDDSSGRLIVLFRHIVEERTRINVRFQFPVDIEKAVTLHMPAPLPEAAVTGALGVQGPPDLKVEAVAAAGRTILSAEELPAELAELALRPLLFGLEFTTPPELELRISKHDPVDLTSTIIDDIQASTVLNEDGVEITKIRLRMRNNTRQYLAIGLPEGAELTHSLVDGQPTRPGVGEGGKLLFPLRQSERLDSGSQRIHVVAEGDTLSDLANFYYSDPSQWAAILNANPDQLSDVSDVQVGQSLRIPARVGATVQESTFVIELAFKRRHDPLGWVGFGNVRLPEVGDVDTVEVTWHLYLPHAISPLAFHSKLTQYEAIRYDPFRRARDFLRRALWVRSAWAGGDYQNFLKQRKGLFRADNRQKDEGKMVLSAFPLVGDRYRFKHILIGQDTPAIGFCYVTREAAEPLRWLALAIAFTFTLMLLRRPRTPRTWIVAAVALGILLLAAHFFLGVHRRIIWGIDLALVLSLLRMRGRSAWQRLVDIARRPWTVVRALTFKNLALWILAAVTLGFVILFPLLLSTTALVILFWCWRRAAMEVTHV